MYVKGQGGAVGGPLNSVPKTEPGPIGTPPPVSNLNYHSKTFKLSETVGTHSDTVISNGKLTLAAGKTTGTFTTNDINIGAFNTMLGSWNAQTNGGRVSMAVQFELSGGTWSTSYYSWGTWSSVAGVSGCSNLTGTHGKMDTDTLTVNSGYTATGKIRIKLTLTSGTGVPVVDNFTVATPQLAKQNTVNTADLPGSVLHNVTMRSQVDPANGSIGSVICSPTTTAMALSWLGTNVTSLAAANAMYDNNWKAYGNWSFAAAYAGEKGYVAYVDYYDVNMIKYALSKGCVIGCSTTLTSSRSGHLVLVVGYKVVSGVEYFVVNDPNVSYSANPPRKDYKVSEFTTSYLSGGPGFYLHAGGTLGVVYVFQGVHDLNNK